MTKVAAATMKTSNVIKSLFLIVVPKAGDLGGAESDYAKEGSGAWLDPPPPF